MYPTERPGKYATKSQSNVATHSNAEQKSADESAREAFDSLLRTQLDQRSLTEKLAYK